MSSFRRDIELLDKSSPWRHWEMDNLEQDSQQRAIASPTATSSSNTQGNTTAETASVAEQIQQVDQASLDQLRLEARAEGYKKGFEQARQSGYEAGYAEASRTANAELQRQLGDTLAPVSAIAEQFANALATLSEDVAGQLVELAMVVGRNLAMDTLNEKPEIVVTVVKSILDRDFAAASRVQLLLHPADVPLVDEQLGAELTALGWLLKADDRISRGGCLVKSDLHQIDATWESRWRAVTARVRRRRDIESATAAAVTEPADATEHSEVVS